MIEIIGPILIVVSIALIIMLTLETWSYYRHTQTLKRYADYASTYAEAAEQFVKAFEETKNAVNYNADIQREVIDKVNTHNKTLAAMSAVLDVHDRVLSLGVWEQITSSEDILPPKNTEK